MSRNNKMLMAVIAVIMVALNILATPTMNDDLMYRFVWFDPSADDIVLKRITSMDDVIESMLPHYLYINGRMIPALLSQILTNLLPDVLVAVLNTAMFMMLMLLTARFACGKRTANCTITMAVAFAMLFLLFAGFYSAVIWPLGSFNYVWSLVIVMLFLMILRRIKDENMQARHTPLLLFALLAGCTHEALTLPVSFALFVYIMQNRQGILRKAVLYLSLCFFIGALIIVATPALWVRADLDGIGLTQRLFLGAVNLATIVRISWLMLATWVVIYFRDKKLFYSLAKENAYPMLAWLAAISLTFVCGSTLERVAFMTDFIAMIIVLRLWQDSLLTKMKTTLTVVSMLLCLLMAVPAIDWNMQNHRNYLYHRQQITNSDNRLIRVRQLKKYNNHLIENLKQRYVMPTIGFGYFSIYMAFDRNEINTRALAKLYGRDYLECLPEDVVERIENDSAAYISPELDSHGDLFIRQLTDNEEVYRVRFILGNEVPLMFYQKPLSYKGDEYELDDFRYEVLTIYGKQYLVMTRPTTNIFRRIRKIAVNNETL